ncbi:MAG: acetyl-CoA carboxylase biotin carboxyl carrier protein [Candidatus Margulisiibacteriota bacterium]
MVDFNLIKKLINMVKDEGISGLTVEEGGVKIEVKREHGGVVKEVREVKEIKEEGKKEEVKEEDGLVAITSPMVGTFYRSPSPDSPPFVQEGDTVKPGQVVCIVEAMKLFNEIESEIGGKIVKVLAENGKPVEYGQKLMLVKKS